MAVKVKILKMEQLKSGNWTVVWRMPDGQRRHVMIPAGQFTEQTLASLQRRYERQGASVR